MTKVIECKACGKKIEIENYSTKTLLQAGWSFVSDISNGLTLVKVCGECDKEIKKHVLAIEDIIKMPFWKIHIHMDKSKYDDK